MRRLVTAALPAALVLLVGSGGATANPGPCTYGFGCGGYCLNLWPRIHQHGPLYNYGPYYGYPPFEPYGYWNAYLQYTGPVGGYGCAGCGGCGHGHNKWGQGNLHALLGSGFGHGCHSCGREGRAHERLLGGELFQHVGLLERLNRLGHDSCCGQCGAYQSSASAAEQYLTAGPATDRYTGYGEPDPSIAYYVGTPNVTYSNTVLPAGYSGR